MSTLPTTTTTASDACTTFKCYLFTPLPHTDDIWAYKGAIGFHLKFLVLMVFVFFLLAFASF